MKKKESSLMETLIKKNYVVEYAHRLPGHEKGCKYIHGHSGGITIVFTGNVDIKTGMVCDFGEFKWLQKIVDEFDHTLVLQKADLLLEYLLIGIDDNKIPPLDIVIFDGPPTAENICKYIVRKIQNIGEYLILHKHSCCLTLKSVKFEETKGNFITERC